MLKIIRPEYLAVAVSVLALFVSLFDPFIALTARSNIVVGLPTSIQLDTNLGHLNLRVKVSLANIGNAPGEFSRVECRLENKNSGSSFEMNVVSIQLGYETTQFTMNVLEPSKTFLNFLNCFGNISEQSIEASESLIRESNIELRKNGFENCNHQAGRTPLVLSSALQSKLMANFDKNFGMVAAPYTLTIVAKDAKGEILSEASADMIVSQAAVDELLRAKDNYAYGLGVSCPPTEIGSVFIRLKN